MNRIGAINAIVFTGLFNAKREKDTVRIANPGIPPNKTPIERNIIQ